MRVARVAGLMAGGGLLAIMFASRSGTASSSLTGGAQFGGKARSQPRLRGIHKIRHVVIIMQENRSFDNYFGTYRRAHGVPRPARHRGAGPGMPPPGEQSVRP